jgi:hypothetical protein
MKPVRGGDACLEVVNFVDADFVDLVDADEDETEEAEEGPRDT